MTAEEFIAGTKEVIERMGVPIIHLHDAKGNCFATILRPTALGQLDITGNKVTDEAKIEFWMRHDHVEPGMW